MKKQFLVVVFFVYISFIEVNGMLPAGVEDLNCSDILKCEMSLSRLHSISFHDFSIGLESRDIKTAKTYWEISDKLLNTLAFCHFLGRKRAPVINNVYTSFQSKIRLLQAISDWMMLRPEEDLDAIAAEYTDISAISYNLLEREKVRTARSLEAEKLHLLQQRQEILNIQASISRSETAIAADMETKTEHLKKTVLKPVEMESDILDQKVQQEKSLTTIQKEKDTRCLSVEQEREEKKKLIALAKKDTMQHISDMEIITFTQDAAIEQKLNSLKEQIEKSITMQKQQRVGRRLMIAKEVFTGLKTLIDTLAEDFAKVGGIIVDHHKAETDREFGKERLQIQNAQNTLVQKKMQTFLASMMSKVKTLRSDIEKIKIASQKAVKDDLISGVQSTLQALEIEGNAIVSDLSNISGT